MFSCSPNPSKAFSTPMEYNSLLLFSVFLKIIKEEVEAAQTNSGYLEVR